jgi:hypothetical protein
VSLRRQHNTSCESTPSLKEAGTSSQFRPAWMPPSRPTPSGSMTRASREFSRFRGLPCGLRHSIPVFGTPRLGTSQCKFPCHSRCTDRNRTGVPADRSGGPRGWKSIVLSHHNRSLCATGEALPHRRSPVAVGTPMMGHASSVQVMQGSGVLAISPATSIIRILRTVPDCLVTIRPEPHIGFLFLQPNDLNF